MREVNDRPPRTTVEAWERRPPRLSNSRLVTFLAVRNGFKFSINLEILQVGDVNLIA